MEEFTELPQFKLQPDIIRRLEEDFCRQHQVVLLGPQPSSYSHPIPLGMLNIGDDEVVEEVQKILSRRVRRIQLNAYEIDQALAFGFQNIKNIGLKNEDGDEFNPPSLELDANWRIEFSREQTPHKILRDLLSQAVCRRATDIHIEVYENDVDLRFRIDGVLQQVTTPLSCANVRSVVSHIKVLASLDIANRNVPQDGRITAYFNDASGVIRRVSFRVAILPGPYGEDAVMRVLDDRKTLLGLEDLGMNRRILDKFKMMVNSPGGLILVTGPTASGKSTTLYAAIKTIATTGKKIMTVEDPIETEMAKVNQKQINAFISFAGYARAFMRQNPDVLMIGEVRDEETASIAMRAAQMGHLVLTTLHTPDAATALGRLMVLGLDKQLLASTVLGILSQRLLRKICPACKSAYEPDPEILKKLPHLPVQPAAAQQTGLPGLAFPISGANTGSYYRGKGCSECMHTGYYERTGVFELLEFDEKRREQCILGEEIPLEGLSSTFDFERMYDDAVDKVAAGITTIEEVIRTVPLKSNKKILK